MTTTTLTSPAGTTARVADRLALPVLLLGSFLATANFFVVNVALPTIGRSLHANAASLQLVVAAYSVSYAAALVAGGRLGDRFGRRRMFVLGLVAFAVSGLACGLAGDVWTLTGARLVQGAAAGIFVPQVLSTIQAGYSGAARQRALAGFGAALGIACVVGQLYGGAAVTFDVAHLTWQLVFWPFAPIALLVAALAVRLVPETRGRPLPLDLRGAALLTLTLVLLLVPLSVGAGAGWPAWAWVGLAAAPVAAYGFVRDQAARERAGGAPLLPPSLVRLPAFRRGLAVVAVFFVGLGGFLLTTGISLQEGLGMSPLGAGFALAPYALGFLAASLTVPRLIGRYAARVIVAGAVVLAVSLAAAAVQAGVGYDGLTARTLLPAFVVIGFGQGLVMIPVFGVVLAGVTTDRAGVASGVLTTTQQAMIAVGVAALGTMFFRVASTGSSTGSSTGTAAGGDWRAATVAVLAAEAALALLTGIIATRLLRSDE
ncbi:Major Facilitator Superfamily protein [Actinopolymorpha cephalotaxi]|uniref:MFS family permease n=1 Tax=Actinopolymorpha cephalotaxi TaxID=504797 RepID=A0A1I3B7V0_9ACTN|nr:MFS transporter [Actinopolymorpha cephalotaxi]NYH81275.1 MFS family permease [Actinopolymorpha cephalotaxi]SFH57781.1 Major Facilitator Superfamily protein [Actinopolymorpha cephalotaxi]